MISDCDYDLRYFLITLLNAQQVASSGTSAKITVDFGKTVPTGKSTGWLHQLKRSLGLLVFA